MDEAIQISQGRFEGVVAVMEEKYGDDFRDVRRCNRRARIELRDLLWLPISFLPTAVSLAIIGWMTGFKPGNSTMTQRFFTMSWLAIGSLVGLRSIHWEEEPREEVSGANRLLWFCAHKAVLLILGPFVGYAFYVVALEIIQFGICKRM